MRTIITFCTVTCLISLAAICLAADSNTPSANNKPISHIGAHPAWDSREGGETIFQAIPITEFPFTDTGATCDNIDDYDAICPHDTPGSPDVVYTFVDPVGGVLMADLCGSSYDTKIYLYDAELNLVDCNDDFYSGEPCGQYTSYIEMAPVERDQQYYLVIDGYGGDCGEYILEADVYCYTPPCVDAYCFDSNMHEGEPEMVDGYVDVYNGGCDAEVPVFQDLYIPAGENHLKLCGWTGWYTTDDVELRDSDWYRMVASGENIHLENQESFFVDMECDVMYIEDCQNVSLLPFQMGTCSAGVIDIPTVPGEVVYLRVRPQSMSLASCAQFNEDYTLTFTGIEQETTAVAPASSAGFVLYTNTPNPFNPRTTITYRIPEETSVTLSIFDLAGRLVDVLVAGEVMSAGTHTADWKGRDVGGRAMSSGTYFYRLEAGEFTETRWMTLIR